MTASRWRVAQDALVGLADGVFVAFENLQEAPLLVEQHARDAAELVVPPARVRQLDEVSVAERLIRDADVDEEKRLHVTFLRAAGGEMHLLLLAALPARDATPDLL